MKIIYTSNRRITKLIKKFDIIHPEICCLICGGKETKILAQKWHQGNENVYNKVHMFRVTIHERKGMITAHIYDPLMERTYDVKLSDEQLLSYMKREGGVT